ncbi:signal peptide peptidase SppA, partial [Candidatus Parvarchaeota archaeon]|nr:signal peptide peptidase SppA [Candidatus Parvarchaeota archaeon]
MDKKANRRHGLDLATGAGASNQQATKEKKDYRLVLLVIFGLVISVGAILGFMILSGIGDGIGGKKEGFSKGLFDSGCIGVVDIRGEIISDDISPGLFSQGVAGSSTIASRIAQADSRDDVKAILLVVDSPGGSVVATREIYDALEASKKPKVAYFREVAASGGYYVGAATDYIVSEPAALTGSIGVRATFTDLSPLFEKIGVNTTIVKSGRFKDIGDSTRPMTDEEKKIIQSMVDEIFEDFKSAVLKHRAGKID